MTHFEGQLQGTTPVVVDFCAEWSAPCQLMEPVLHEVKEVAGDRVTILKLDVDKEPAFAGQYGVTSVPTLIIFREGNVLWRKSGVFTAHDILAQLNLHMT